MNKELLLILIEISKFHAPESIFCSEIKCKGIKCSECILGGRYLRKPENQIIKVLIHE